MRTINKLYNDAGDLQTPTAGVYTLTADTYYAELAEFVDERSKLSVQWTYDSALVATITIEATNRDDLTIYDTSATAGWATTSATAVSPAASAGTALQHYADFVAARVRAKIVVATGGTLMGHEHSKRS